MNLLRKLTSRKFWAAVAAFVTTVLTALNVSALTIEQVTAIIAGVGALIAFIVAEGYVDAKRAEVEAVGDDKPPDDKG